MRINNNIAALNTLRQYTSNTTSTNKAMEKLSSGLAINRAGDDAAGLAISEKMRSQIRGIEMASDNSQNAISLVQTAEGALTETHSILQRMNELAVQSASDTNETIDRNALQAEYSQLVTEIDDIADQTKFNNRNLLDGTYSGATAEATHTGLASDLDVSVTTAASAGSITLNTISDWAATVTAANGTATADFTATAGITAGSVAGSVADGANYNGTYHLQATGSALNAMTFNLVDADGATVASTGSVTVTAGGANTLNFGNYGNLSITTGAGVTAGNLTTAYDGTSSGNFSITIAGGVDAVSVPSATLNGVQIKQGDTSATLATGVTIDLSALTSADWASQNALNTALYGSTTGSGSITVATTAAKTGLTVQTGANNGESLSININSMKSADLGLTGSTVATQAGAATAINTVTDAINEVSTQRANLGAYQNRLEHKINNLDTSAENLQAAESNIRDVDMAEEMVEFTKNNILLQAAQSMLAQANSQPQGVLQLLQ